VGGVLYPPEFLDALAFAGSAFTELAPRADDVWLHSVSLSSGVQSRLVDFFRDDDFLAIRGTGAGSLMSDNVARGGNDEQIVAVGTAELLARTSRSSTRE